MADIPLLAGFNDWLATHDAHRSTERYTPRHEETHLSPPYHWQEK